MSNIHEVKVVSIGENRLGSGDYCIKTLYLLNEHVLRVQQMGWMS